ncbi:MAG: M42 family metallopeptidase [bacterium]|nr:M42 family metallopeptidase [bacterium]
MYLKELTELLGVSGYEKKVREFIKEKINNKVDSIEEDPLGNLIAKKKGKTDKRLLLCAHMDEVGFIVSNIEEDGKLSILPLGGIDTRSIIGKKVLVGEKEIPGIIGFKAIHLQRDEIYEPPRMENIKVDIGVTKKTEAESKVRIGDFVAFSVSSMEHKGWFSGKALDDRGGCSILMDIIDSDIDLYYETYFVFSVQEELGLRGAGVSAERVSPDLAIVIETTTSGDNPEFPSDRRSTELGKGPAITFAHSGYVIDERLFKWLINTARENNIPYQVKRRTVGGTDARRIATTLAGIPSAVISIPARYIHSPMSVINLDDYANTLKLVSILLTKEAKI